MAVQVQAVALHIERLPNIGGQVVVCLFPTSCANHDVGLNDLARLRLHPVLHQAFHFALFALELGLSPVVQKGRVQDMCITVEVGDHVQLWSVTAPLATLDLEKKLNDAEGDPHQREQQVGQNRVNARRPCRPSPFVPGHQGLAEARQENVLERNQPCNEARCAPMSRSEQQRRRRLCHLRSIDDNVDRRLATANDDHVLPAGRALVQVL
mmetsp:Transcript_434/g.841  ORF Transcript_434/g.841 Transcript_434/m.841 type:complete len:210 (+) Transcript_434:495-1124(+)